VDPQRAAAGFGNVPRDGQPEPMPGSGLIEPRASPEHVFGTRATQPRAVVLDGDLLSVDVPISRRDFHATTCVACGVLDQGAQQFRSGIRIQRKQDMWRDIDVEHAIGSEVCALDDAHHALDRAKRRRLRALRDRAQASDPGACELRFDGRARRSNRAVQSVRCFGGSGCARTPALRRERSEWRLESVREIRRPAARGLEVLLPCIGQGIDRLRQRLDLGRVIAGETGGRVCVQFSELLAQAPQRPQSQFHLQPSGSSEHGPQHKQVKRQLPGELVACGADERAVLCELHQNRGTFAVRAYYALYEEELLVERPGGGTRLPFVARCARERRQRLIPQRM